VLYSFISSSELFEAKIVKDCISFDSSLIKKSSYDSTLIFNKTIVSLLVTMSLLSLGRVFGRRRFLLGRPFFAWSRALGKTLTMDNLRKR
jgi:hypothetical protein